MRRSCQNCYLTCAPPDKGLSDEANYCLNTCLKKDCIGQGTENGVKVADQFRCLVHRLRCSQDVSESRDVVRNSCGTCAEACNFPFSRDDRKYCEDQCSIRNLTCAPKPRSVINNSNNSSDNLSPALKTGDLNMTTNSKSNEEIWDWLGPVLGAVVTIFAAIITVTWVHNNRQVGNDLFLENVFIEFHVE